MGEPVVATPLISISVATAAGELEVLLSLEAKRLGLELSLLDESCTEDTSGDCWVEGASRSLLLLLLQPNSSNARHNSAAGFAEKIAGYLMQGVV